MPNNNTKTDKKSVSDLRPKKVVDGIPYTLWSRDVDLEAIDKVRNMDYRPTDVIISGHPRTGNTWTMAVVWLILHDADIEGFKSQSQLDRVCKMENVQPGNKLLVDRVDTYPDPRVLFAHIHYKFLASNFLKTNNKVIYCMRNPKDTMVSMYEAINSFMKFRVIQALGYVPDFESVIRFLTSPVADNGNIFEQILAWWEHRDNPNIYFCYYEDMKADPFTEVRKLAAFLGKDLTDYQIDDIVEATTVKSMKNIYEGDTKSNGDKKAVNRSQLVRKGEVGGWKDYFTVEQNEWFDQQIQKHWAGTGLKFTYE